MSTVGREYGKKTENHGKKEKHPLDDLKMTQITKNVKMRNAILKDLEYGEKTENHENEKYTLLGRKYGAGKLKRWKIQKCPLQDGNMARKLKIMEK